MYKTDTAQRIITAMGVFLTAKVIGQVRRAVTVERDIYFVIAKSRSITQSAISPALQSINQMTDI